jgi:hypothetical protein
MRIRPVRPDELPVFACWRGRRLRLRPVDEWLDADDMVFTLLKVVGARLDVQPFGHCRK